MDRVLRGKHLGLNMAWLAGGHGNVSKEEHLLMKEVLSGASGFKARQQARMELQTSESPVIIALCDLEKACCEQTTPVEEPAILRCTSYASFVLKDH